MYLDITDLHKYLWYAIFSPKHLVHDKYEFLPPSTLPSPCAPAMPRHRADDVQLVVLKGQVAWVHVHDVVGVVDPEYRVGAVPVKAVHSNGADMDSKQGD